MALGRKRHLSRLASLGMTTSASLSRININMTARRRENDVSRDEEAGGNIERKNAVR